MWPVEINCLQNRLYARRRPLLAKHLVSTGRLDLWCCQSGPTKQEVTALRQLATGKKTGKQEDRHPC